MEIIAIPTNGKGGLNEDLSTRFGRCSSFTFVTLENNEIKSVKTVPNHASEAMGGAGALNLKVIEAPNETLSIKKVIDLYIGGELQEISGSNVSSHFGANSG